MERSARKGQAKWLVIFGIVLIAIVVLIISLGNKSSSTTSEGPIKIGFIGPLTGDAAAYGEPIRQVIQLAIEEINTAGGVNGRMIEFIYEDGACTPKNSATSAQKLIDVNGVKVILGGFCSGETLGAAPIAEAAKVILFSAGSGSPDITKAGDYIFRNFPSDASSGSKVAREAVKNEHTNIAIIAEQTDYAQAVKKVFKDTLVGEDGNVAVDEAFSSDATDFRTPLTKIKDANPDAIYLIAQTPAKYGLVLKQLREMGIDQQIYTNEFAAAQDILKEYGDEIEGAIYAEPAFNAEAPAAAALLENIKTTYGSLSGDLPPVYFATAYDAVYILKEAVEKCGEDTNCIKTALYAIKNRPGTAGPLSIDGNGDASFEYEVKQITNGKPTVVG